MVHASSSSRTNRKAKQVVWADETRSSVSLAARRSLLVAAVDRDKDNIELRRALAHLHCEMGSHEDAVRVVGAADDPELKHLLGKALLALGDYERAEQVLRGVCREGFAQARIELAETLDHLGNHHEALDICDDIMRAEPASIIVFRITGNHCLRQRDGLALRNLCERYADIHALATLRHTFDIAASELLGEIGPHDLIDMHQADVRISTLEDQDWGSAGSRTALRNELDLHPNKMKVAHRQSTQNGVRVADILSRPLPVAADLAQTIKQEVEAYLEDKSKQVFGPGRLTNDRVLSLNMWAVLLSEGGYQEWHMHPSALISGVFYVDAPADCADEDSTAGWLEFGTANNLHRNEAGWTYPIKPSNGSLVLFPSAFIHRTRPHEGDRPRISIAFDVAEAL